MRIETVLTLTNGRRVSIDSAEFRERLPISAAMFDRIALASSDLAGAFEVISAAVQAVVLLEARGVEFDD